ncbi:hypothetical protein BKA66DRAFT_436733 [Pyrenochaeta sp. MPI-SDFR-AT-0127]|nr:hypothetical protein BKA66DRAFT_436733 [Pyrenochaeta sp. MPI-SDFR-AT-0127]
MYCADLGYRANPCTKDGDGAFHIATSICSSNGGRPPSSCYGVTLERLARSHTTCIEEKFKSTTTICSYDGRLPQPLHSRRYEENDRVETWLAYSTPTSSPRGHPGKEEASQEKGPSQEEVNYTQALRAHDRTGGQKPLKGRRLPKVWPQNGAEPTMYSTTEGRSMLEAPRLEDRYLDEVIDPILHKYFGNPTCAVSDLPRDSYKAHDANGYKYAPTSRTTFSRYLFSINYDKYTSAANLSGCSGHRETQRWNDAVQASLPKEPAPALPEAIESLYRYQMEDEDGSSVYSEVSTQAQRLSQRGYCQCSSVQSHKSSHHSQGIQPFDHINNQAVRQATNLSSSTVVDGPAIGPAITPTRHENKSKRSLNVGLHIANKVVRSLLPIRSDPKLKTLSMSQHRGSRKSSKGKQRKGEAVDVRPKPARQNCSPYANFQPNHSDAIAIYTNDDYALSTSDVGTLWPVQDEDGNVEIPRNRADSMGGHASKDMLSRFSRESSVVKRWK